MPRQPINPTIVKSFADDTSEEDLDLAIRQLREAYLSSSFQNLSVLGVNVGQNKDDVENILETLSAAKVLKQETADTALAAMNLDARGPLGTGFDFSCRHIE